MSIPSLNYRTLNIIVSYHLKISINMRVAFQSVRFGVIARVLYFAHVGALSIEIRVSVCLLAYLKPKSKFHPSFQSTLPVAWLGLPLTAMQFYVLPFFCMTSCFHTVESISQNQRRRVCFFQFDKWRHRGEVYRFRLHLFAVRL